MPMSFRIKRGCMQLADILALAEEDYNAAELQYAKFEARYAEEEIDAVNKSLSGEFGVF